MRKLILSIFCLISIISCKKDDAKEQALEIKKTVDLDLERFDVLYSQSTPETLPQLKQAFPFLFPSQFPDSTWTNKLKDKYFVELNAEVKKAFPNTSELESQTEMLISRVKHYFPEEKTPRVISLVNYVDLEKKALYTNDFLFISLDTYLGSGHKFYKDFPEYQKVNLERNQILPDIVTSFGFRKVLPSQEESLLAEMIYFGKVHYLKDVLIPEVKDHNKIGYSEIQYKWCLENEAMIWSYFIDKKLLYENNLKNNQRFIDDAPFTKFYLPIDMESPGRIGQWIGWQIVRSYMENNDITVAELMKKQPLEIFNDSKYKPKK